MVYIALYKDKKYVENVMWIRPLKIFIEKVEVDGKNAPRLCIYIVDYAGEKI